MAYQDTAPSTRNLPFPDWQLEYQAALLEVDPQKLPDRVLAAEAAIFLRQQALVSSSDGHVERQAIEDAVRALLFIKNEKLGYPDSLPSKLTRKSQPRY